MSLAMISPSTLAPSRRRSGWFAAALVAAALVAPLSGCATDSGSEAPPTYQSMVEKTYATAEEAFADGDYLEALSGYNTVRSRFPYSQYAALAGLRLGDVYYEQEKYPSAIEQYRNFLKLHPNHERADYANYRIAMSFYGDMPGDYFFMPPSYEKDLSKTKDAEREFRLFLNRYEDSEYAIDARRKLAEIRRRMADHELYVAGFYLDRDRPRAAAMRLTYLLENYSGLGLDASALFLLARSYLELGDAEKARRALQDLIDYHPQSPLASRAQEYLSEHDLGG